MNVPTLVRFSDLKERGIVDNRTTLKNWIDRGLFPTGRLMGPNTRVWTEAEIIDYIETRPRDRKTAAAA
jgi:hypothetical protein